MRRDTKTVKTATPRFLIDRDSTSNRLPRSFLRWFPLPQRANGYHQRVNFPRSGFAQSLLIDADDTLWENNIYFERAIADFISFLNHRERTPLEVRQILNDVERDCIVSHGYGLKSFAHALVKTFERISVEPITPGLHQAIHGFAHTIARQPIQLLAGVEKTLGYLARRHRLVMVTKGDPHEQSGKVERSGLKQYFSAVEVVAEKDEPTYAGVITKHEL